MARGEKLRSQLGEAEAESSDLGLEVTISADEIHEPHLICLTRRERATRPCAGRRIAQPLPQAGGEHGRHQFGREAEAGLDMREGHRGVEQEQDAVAARLARSHHKEWHGESRERAAQRTEPAHRCGARQGGVCSTAVRRDCGRFSIATGNVGWPTRCDGPSGAASTHRCSCCFTLPSVRYQAEATQIDGHWLQLPCGILKRANYVSRMCPPLQHHASQADSRLGARRGRAAAWHRVPAEAATSQAQLWSGAPSSADAADGAQKEGAAHRVRNGAAQAKGADPAQAGAGLGIRVGVFTLTTARGGAPLNLGHLGRKDAGTPLQRRADVCIQHAQLRVWTPLSAPHPQREAQQAGSARGRLRVADVGLETAHHWCASFWAFGGSRQHHRRIRANLDGIP
eukprot:scaffold1298_cov98-Isochrysis_galbana.AAC.5